MGYLIRLVKPDQKKTGSYSGKGFMKCLLAVCMLFMFMGLPQTTYAATMCNRCNVALTITSRATCKSPAKAICKKCGSNTTIGSKKPHTYGSYVTVKKATCKSTGQKKRVCLVCGKSEMKTIAKTRSHSFEHYKRATCSSRAIRKCKVCGLLESYGSKSPSTHSWGKPQNCFKKCKLCGKVEHI